MEKPNIVSKKQYDEVILESLKFGVNPFLIFAIGLHETDWGNKGWGRHGYILGVGCYNEKDSDESLRGFHQQIEWACRAISEFIGFRVTEQALLNFAKYVWKPGNPAVWAADVWSRYVYLVNSYAPELPICQVPPDWVVPALQYLYSEGVVNTPYGDLDFYRTVQVAYNFMLVFGGKK